MQLDRSLARISTLQTQGREDHPDYEVALEHARIVRTSHLHVDGHYGHD